MDSRASVLNFYAQLKLSSLRLWAFLRPDPKDASPDFTGLLSSLDTAASSHF